ncbi:hypothetical protein LCGC14_2026220, partial [marine sediment metagenome]
MALGDTVDPIFTGLTIGGKKLMDILGLDPITNIGEGKFNPIPIGGQIVSKLFRGVFGGGPGRNREAGAILKARGDALVPLFNQVNQGLEDLGLPQIGQHFRTRFGEKGPARDAGHSRSIQDFQANLAQSFISFIDTTKTEMDAFMKNNPGGLAMDFAREVQTRFSRELEQQRIKNQPKAPHGKSPIEIGDLARLALNFTGGAKPLRFRSGQAGGFTFAEQAKEQDLIIPPGFTSK